MNIKFTRVAAIMMITVATIFSSSVSAQGRPGVSYQDFYDELSPYGEWVDYPDYGYVWVPDAGPDFQPYSTNGRWVWSDDYDWMWVSDYDWGWAPFHYGRWFQDPGYGWMWMPGYDWSPAWVAWRDGGDYYGWAPLRPGITISIGVSLGGYNPPINYWCFTPRRYIGSYGINRYCVDRSRNVTIINNTTIINNYNYGRRGNNIFVNGGPGRRDAERYAGRITPIRFSESSRPGRDQYRGNRVSMYRPEIRRDDNRGFAPRSYNRYDRDRSTANRFDGNNNGRRDQPADRGERDFSSRGNDRPDINRDENRRPDVVDRSGNDRQIGNDNTNRRDERINTDGNGGRRNVFDRNRSDRDQNTPPVTDNSRRRNVFERPSSGDDQVQDNNRRRNDDRINTPGRNDNDAPVRRNVFGRTDRVEKPNMPQRRQPATQPGSDGGGRRNVFDRSQRSADAPQQRSESSRMERRSSSEQSQGRSSEGRRGGFGRRG